MPKMKTRKCAAKRLKKTGTGKYRHNKPALATFLQRRVLSVNVVSVRMELLAQLKKVGSKLHCLTACSHTTYYMLF